MVELCFNCNHQKKSHTSPYYSKNGLVAFTDCKPGCNCTLYQTHDDYYQSQNEKNNC